MQRGASAGAWCEGVPVAVADDGGTLCCSVSDGVGEVDFLEELFHFLVEGCASDDDFVELSAEGIDHLFADFLVYLEVDDGHLHEQSHDVGLYLGEDFLAYDFLDDQRHGNDDDGLDAGECLGNDGRRWYSAEVIDVASVEELEDEFESHAVHVSHGQDADDAVALLDSLTEHVDGEVVVGPQGAVGHHDAF